MEQNKSLTPRMKQISDQCSCRQPYSTTNTPMLICYDCQQIRCQQCIRNVPEDYVECSQCVQTVRKQELKIDQETLKVVELLKKRQDQVIQKVNEKMKKIKQKLRAHKEKYTTDVEHLKTRVCELQNQINALRIQNKQTKEELKRQQQEKKLTLASNEQLTKLKYENKEIRKIEAQIRQSYHILNQRYKNQFNLLNYMKDNIQKEIEAHQEIVLPQEPPQYQEFKQLVKQNKEEKQQNIQPAALQDSVLSQWDDSVEEYYQPEKSLQKDQEIAQKQQSSRFEEPKNTENKQHQIQKKKQNTKVEENNKSENISQKTQQRSHSQLEQLPKTKSEFVERSKYSSQLNSFAGLSFIDEDEQKTFRQSKPHMIIEKQCTQSEIVQSKPKRSEKLNEGTKEKQLTKKAKVQQHSSFYNQRKSQVFDEPWVDDFENNFTYPTSHIQLSQQPKALPRAEPNPTKEGSFRPHMSETALWNRLYKLKHTLQNDSKLQIRFKEDNVINEMRQFDTRRRLFEYEYFYIGTVEQKKAQAISKVTMVVNARQSGQFLKYQRFELYMFSFTLDKILSVPLANERIFNLIDLSPLINLTILNLSFNLLQSLKPIEKNIKLECLWVHCNQLSTLDGIGSLSALKQLSIYCNPLKLRAFDYLSKCNFSKLMKIGLGSNCGNTQFQNDCLALLMKMNKLCNLKEIHVVPSCFSQCKEIIAQFNMKFRAKQNRSDVVKLYEIKNINN